MTSMASATTEAASSGSEKRLKGTMSSLWSSHYYLPIIAIAVLVSILRQPAGILGLLGRVEIDPTSITHWANSSGLNDERCTVNYAANACEDVAIHFGSKTAFVACGDPVGRSHWYPPACVRDTANREERTFRESIFKYDIRKKQTTELKIEGLSGDFVNHGIDIYSFPDNPEKIHLFAVKHARDGDSIAIFSHLIGSDSLQLVQDVKHPNIKNANGVVATGPLSFYFTNDHYFVDGILRDWEEKSGPWTWATHVQYCDATAATVACRQVTKTFPGANGIGLWEDRVFVGDSKAGTLTVFQMKEDQELEELHTVALGAAADNIKIIPTTGDIVVSIFPGLEDLPTYLANVHELGKTVLAPAGALRLRRSNDYTTRELIWFNDGSVLSDMTAGSIDPYSNVFIGAAVLQFGGFAVCELRPDALA